jgi:hypothetical protein
MPTNSSLEKPFLLKLDPLLMAALEHERLVAAKKRGVYRADGSIKLSPRTTVLRDLLREAVDARRQARGEPIPVVEVGVVVMESTPAACCSEDAPAPAEYTPTDVTSAT